MGDLEEQIRIAGEQRLQARAEARRQGRILSELIQEAHARGMTKTKIAKLAGISRTALDEMLKRKDPGA